MLLRDLLELAHLRVGQPVRPEPERADQRAMHDEVGVAADRRGEVRIAAQVQTEMAEIVGAVFGLGLAAQHHLADELGHRASRASRRGCG